MSTACSSTAPTIVATPTPTAPEPQHRSTTTAGALVPRPDRWSRAAASRTRNSVRRRGTNTPGCTAIRTPRNSAQPRTCSSGSPSARRATMAASSSAVRAEEISNRASSSAKTHPAARSRLTMAEYRSADVEVDRRPDYPRWRSGCVDRGHVEEHAVVRDQPVVPYPPDRHRGKRDLLAVQPGVGHLGLRDRVGVDSPFVQDPVAQAPHGGQERPAAGRDSLPSDQRLAVAEHHRGVLGEHIVEGVRVHRVDLLENADGAVHLGSPCVVHVHAVGAPVGAWMLAPYRLLTSAIRAHSSGLVGGAWTPARAGVPASRKNCSKPAGVTRIKVRAAFTLGFLNQCGTPRGRKTKSPARATVISPPAAISSTPSSR